MKILHIISQTPDFTGSGKFIGEMIRQSGRAGHENYLVAGAPADFDLPDAFMARDHCVWVRFDGQDLDFPIPGMSDVMPYHSSVFSRLSRRDMVAYQIAFDTAIRSAIHRFQPDVVHTHHLWVVSALARTIAPQIPMVTTCHGTCLRQHSLCPNIGQQITADLQKIDQIIALSLAQKQDIVAALGVDSGKIKVISGGYNPGCFFYAPRTFDGGVELLYAGKLSSAKGVPWLLKSLEKISDLPFRLHLAGTSTGRQKEICLELLRALGPRGVYHGPLSHEELGCLMRRSHVFVLPSFFEGLPLVLIEALACGCRIVATALPGVRALFDPGHDTMVRLMELPALKTIDTPHEKDKPGLEMLLARTLEQTLGEIIHNAAPDRAYISSVASSFTWEKIFSKVQKVYTLAHQLHRSG